MQTHSNMILKTACYTIYLARLILIYKFNTINFTIDSIYCIELLQTKA